MFLKSSWFLSESSSHSLFCRINSILLESVNVTSQIHEPDEVNAMHSEHSIAAREQIHHNNQDPSVYMSCLGKIYHERQLYNEALYFYHQSLHFEKILHGYCSKEVAVTLKIVGNILFEQGNLSSSLEIRKQLLSIELKAFGLRTLTVLSTLKDIAEIYDQLSYHDKLMELYRLIVFIQKMVLGQHHEDVVTTLNKLGYLLRQGGRLFQALTTFQKSLQSYASSDVAFDRSWNQSYDIMVEVLTKACQERSDFTVDQTHEAIVALSNIALIFQDIGDQNRALKYHKLTLCLQKNQLKIYHRNVVTTLCDIGQIYLELDEGDKALEALELALRIQKQFLEENNIAVARTLQVIGTVYFHRGEISEMMSAFAESVRIYREAGISDEVSTILHCNFDVYDLMHQSIAAAGAA